MGGREGWLDAARHRADRARCLRRAVAIRTRSGRAGLSRAKVNEAKPAARQPPARSFPRGSACDFVRPSPRARTCRMARLRHASMLASAADGAREMWDGLGLAVDGLRQDGD